mgnify:CR=1 FL=1
MVTGMEEIGNPTGGQRTNVEEIPIDLAKEASEAVRTKRPVFRNTGSGSGQKPMSAWTEELMQQGFLKDTRKKEQMEDKRHINTDLCAFQEASFLMEIQGVLSLFVEPQVRGDFLDGLIMELDDPEQMLIGLDHMRTILVPAFKPRREDRKYCYSVCLRHIKRLIEKDTCIFVFSADLLKLCEYSYADWATILKKLCLSSYWLNHTYQQKSGKTGDQGKDPVDLGNFKSRNLNGSNKKRISSPTRNTQCSWKSNERSWDQRNRIEEIEIYSSDSSGDEDDISIELGSYRHGRCRAVKPPAFDIGGPQSLKRFLESFEKYFHSRYEGGERECSMELAKFLEGETLEAYNSFGGPEKRYSALKSRLLEWHAARELHGAKKWRSKLSLMKMNSGETFRLFALRIQEVAQKAYPRDNRECAKKMMEVYTRAVPEWFNVKLDQRLEIKEMLEHGRKLTWSDVLKLAEREDRNARDQRLKCSLEEPLDSKEGIWVGYGVGASPSKGVLNVGAPEFRPADGMKPLNSALDPRSQEREEASPIRNNLGGRVKCNWCGKPHKESECWLKHGACLLCGSMTHMRRNCPKFKRRQSSGLQCSNCGGPHLGMNCSRRERSEN